MREYIEDFYSGEMMTVGRGNVADYSPAFERWMADQCPGPVGNPTIDKRRFQVPPTMLEFTQPEYHFSRGLDLFGGWLSGNPERPPRLIFHDATRPCIRTHAPKVIEGGTPPDYVDMPGGTHPSGFGGPSHISDLVIDGTGVTNGGIYASSRLEAWGVTVDKCDGNGIEISADVKRPEHSNANVSRLERCVVTHCTGDGFVWRGGDASSGYTLACRAESNGGYGLNDSSFFGNIHIGPLLINNRGGAIRTNSANQGAPIIGPYVENAPSPSTNTIDVMRESLVLGGTGGILVPGSVRYRGRSVEGQVEHRGTQGALRTGVPDAIFDIAPTGSYPVAFQASRAGFIDVELNRINQCRAFAITTEKQTAYEPGRVVFEQGYYEGTCKRIVAIAPPAVTVDAAGKPSLPLGTTCRTPMPTPGQPYEWVLCLVGTEYRWCPGAIVGGGP